MPAPVDHAGVQARLQPENAALHDLSTGRRWTYADLDEAIGRVHAALARRGIAAGDRVGCLARNRPEIVILHLACARLGAVFVPLNWRLTPGELRGLIDDCEPALLVGDDMLDRSGLEGAKLDVFMAEAEACASAPPAVFERSRASLILYTSGTSGRPKGVVLSERNLDQTAVGFSVLGQVDRRSAILCDAPMFHVIGLVTNIRPALMRGAKLLISDGFDSERSFARLADPGLGVSHYFCVPQMAKALRAVPGFTPEPLRRLTGLFTGGAPHPPAAIRAWLEDGIAVADGYGMTEAGTVFGMPLDCRRIARKAGSVGVGLPYVRARIGEGGELQLRGPSISEGYWRNPEATAASRTADGWFRTGDVAEFDEEGFCWLKGRLKEMYISGGENVYPAEIEAVLAGHPLVRDCAVIGVPDERWGEAGCLFIVWAAGARDEAAILSHLRARLAGYKIPRHIRHLNALPRNGTGKIVKAALAELFAQSGSPA